MTRERLQRMSLAELEAKLSEVRSKFLDVTQDLSRARREQILKSRKIRGSANEKKARLISQIRKLEASIEKVETKISLINFQKSSEFDRMVAAATDKVESRKLELKMTGAYSTVLNTKDKVLYWCGCMGYDWEDLDMMLEYYTWEDLEDMEGDEFYDEVRRKRVGYDGPKSIMEEIRKTDSKITLPERAEVVIF